MRYLTTLAVLAVVACPAFTDEKLAGIACRSVHLGYSAPASTAFYNEAAVVRSSPGTYFCVCGFNHGYYGIQELANGKKLLIFSVWDPGRQDDPKQVAAERRVKLLHQGEGVRVGRFGGEGTGGQSFYDFDWKIGETYRFLVTATPDGDERTAFAGYFFHPGKKAWLHLITFSTITRHRHLGGYYSFVEDFRRNRVSATQARKAYYGNGWVKPATGDWIPLVKATFTADSNPATNIDAGPDGMRFFLTTGGDTKNQTTKLRHVMTREAGGRPPADLPK
jgi:hypothetical protein